MSEAHVVRGKNSFWARRVLARGEGVGVEVRVERKSMAEGSSPTAKRAKVDGVDSGQRTGDAPGAEVNGGRGKVALVTGITGQVSARGRQRKLLSLARL